MIQLILLFLIPLAQANFCNKFYKGILIDCSPAPHEFMSKEYWWTEKQIEQKCRDYIDKMKIDTRNNDYCPVPAWCTTLSMNYGCHQMSGGMFSIDGDGTPAHSPSIFRRKAK